MSKDDSGLGIVALFARVFLYKHFKKRNSDPKYIEEKGETRKGDVLKKPRLKAFVGCVETIQL